MGFSRIINKFSHNSNRKNKFISLEQGVHSFVKSQQVMQKSTSLIIIHHKINISYLDQLKLKYYELTGQTKKYQQALIQAGTAAQKHGKTQMQMINGFQGVGMAIASLGGMMTMFGEITGNELASSTGNMTMLFGTILAFVPQLVNGFQMIIQGVRLLTLANIKSAIVMAAAWWPLYTALYAIYLLYSAFSKVKPKPLDLTTPLTTQPTASMTGTNPVTASPLGGSGTYLRPYIGTGATAQPMVGPPSAMATTYMPSTPVNDNSTTIHICYAFS